MASAANPPTHEPHPDPHALTHNPDSSQNTSSGIDYLPHPEHSVTISPARQAILDAITRLYSGSASEEDMQVYTEKAIYDDVRTI